MEGLSPAPEKVKKIVFGKKSKVVLLCGFIGLNTILFGLFYFLNNTQENKTFLSNVPGQIESPKPNASKPPEQTTEETEYTELDDVSSQFINLNKELDEQITNIILSRRNYLLGKAMNSVASKGKTLQYWLSQDFGAMQANLKQELLTRSQNSISGLGGEYTGNAQDSEKARSLIIDLKAVTLAMEFIKDTPSNYISPEVLVSRVSVGKALDLSATLDVAIKAKIQQGMWESVEKHRMKIESDASMAKDTEEAIQELSDGNTSKKDSQ